MHRGKRIVRGPSTKRWDSRIPEMGRGSYTGFFLGRFVCFGMGFYRIEALSAIPNPKKSCEGVSP